MSGWSVTSATSRGSDWPPPAPTASGHRAAGPRSQAAESAGGRWVFDGAGSITGSLHMTGEDAVSTVEPERFVDMVASELAVLDRRPRRLGSVSAR